MAQFSGNLLLLTDREVPDLIPDSVRDFALVRNYSILSTDPAPLRHRGMGTASHVAVPSLILGRSDRCQVHITRNLGSY